MSDTGFEKARKLLEDIKSYVIDNEQALESFRIEFVGAKSSIKSLFGEIKNIPDDKKKEFGQFLNEIKMKPNADLRKRNLNLRDHLQSQNQMKLTFQDLLTKLDSGQDIRFQ